MKAIYIRALLLISLIFPIMGQSAGAADIVQAVSEYPADTDVVFALDSMGSVFGFLVPPDHPESTYNLSQINNLKNIKNIVPYAAVDGNGEVFLWGVTKLDSNEGVISAISFSGAQKLAGIRHVTDIDYYDHHFVAISNNTDIYAWNTGKSTAEGDNNLSLATPTKIFSSPLVKKISLDHSIELHFKKGHEGQNAYYIGSTTYFGYLTLLNDGTLVGINTDSNGDVLHGSEIDLKPVVIGIFKGATDIQANFDSIAVVYENGTASYINKCQTSEKNSEDKWVVVNGMHEAKAKVNDVVKLAKNPIHIFRNLFVKTNGAVWTEYSPYNSIPPSPYKCVPKRLGLGFDDYGFGAISFSNLKPDVHPKAEYVYGNMMVDSEHNVWVISGLKNDTYSQVNLNFNKAIR